jgi:hypothetical protein
MKTVRFYPMTKFPTYGVYQQGGASGAAPKVGEHDYEYWAPGCICSHRTELPHDKIREIAASPVVRRTPSMVDHLLPDTCLSSIWTITRSISKTRSDATALHRRAEAPAAPTWVGMT